MRTFRPNAVMTHLSAVFALAFGMIGTSFEAAVGQAREVRQILHGAVMGVVVDAETGRPIEGVELRVERARRVAITDGEGRFRIDEIEPGEYTLVSYHIAYAERVDSLDIPDGALLDLTVALSIEAVELEDLVVTVRSPVLERQGFYGRQQQGFGGVFVDRVEIERKNPKRVTDLFMNMPGIRVIYGGINGSAVFMNQRVNFRDENLPGCEPQLWLDGVRSTMRIYDYMRAEEIEGIEVYTGGAAPGKFYDICGTVAIWTRVPINSRR